jgi:hypothetical protein
MIGSDLEGSDLESRVASWAGVVSQYTASPPSRSPSSKPS